MRLFAAFLIFCLPALGLTEEYRPSGAASSAVTYVFGIHPYSSPQDIYIHYTPILRYLEGKLPGTRFEVEASRDYADYEAKLAARRFHFSLPNPAQTVASFEHGYRVIAKMTPDDDFRGLFIARATDAPASPRELEGQFLCFTSPTALAGTLQPLMWLHDQGGDVKSLRIRHVGSQFSSILNAWSGGNTPPAAALPASSAPGPVPTRRTRTRSTPWCAGSQAPTRASSTLPTAAATNYSPMSSSNCRQ